MTTAIADIALPTTDELRTLARTSLLRCGVDLAVLEKPSENTITAAPPSPVRSCSTSRLLTPPPSSAPSTPRTRHFSSGARSPARSAAP
jgi:hypothetical protein